MSVFPGSSDTPALSVSPVVGCNPCVLQCDIPGSPPVPTTTSHSPIKDVVEITHKKPTIKAADTDGDGQLKHKSNAGLVVGIVIAVLALLSVGIGAVVWYFRFRK